MKRALLVPILILLAGPPGSDIPCPPSCRSRPAPAALPAWPVTPAATPIPILPPTNTQADPQYFRFQRTLKAQHSSSHATAPTALTPQPSPQVCAILDAQIFPHAAPSLRDLRLYAAPDDPHPAEIPYALTLSEPAQPDAEPAAILNFAASAARSPRERSFSFDLRMPPRPYTEVTLDLAAADFLATATVTGRDDRSPQTSCEDCTARSDPQPRAPVPLGAFTLFDLTTRHLGRNTTIALQESTFSLLHIDLILTPAPGAPVPHATSALLPSASVPPSREAQTLYTTVASAPAFTNGSQTSAWITLPLRVPVERLTVDLPSSYTGNFSRTLTLQARPDGAPTASTESFTGTILKVQTTLGGHQISQRQLSLPATLGSNLQNAAHVLLTIDNGTDAPLPITSVRLEMRQRKLCFGLPSQPSGSSPADSVFTLLYGDPTLVPPNYIVPGLAPAAHSSVATLLGPELPNPSFHPRSQTRSLTDRHPELFWIALLAAICLLALTAFRTARILPR